MEGLDQAERDADVGGIGTGDGDGVAGAFVGGVGGGGKSEQAAQKEGGELHRGGDKQLPIDSARGLWRPETSICALACHNAIVNLPR